MALQVVGELPDRCVVLTISVSREQTAAIHARQRQARTFNTIEICTRVVPGQAGANGFVPIFV